MVMNYNRIFEKEFKYSTIITFNGGVFKFIKTINQRMTQTETKIKINMRIKIKLKELNN
jgi:hypothetical protein